MSAGSGLESDLSIVATILSGEGEPTSDNIGEQNVSVIMLEKGSA